MNFVRFSESLAARYWALEVGLVPGDIQELIKMAGTQKGRQPMSKTAEQKIRSIILAADKLAEKRRQK